MPLFLIVFGIILVVAGVHGTAKDTLTQLKTDVTGFLAFGVAILILGLLGEIKSIRPVAIGLLVLVFAVFLLKNGNQFFSNLTGTVKSQ